MVSKLELQEVRVEVDERVATITLNRPEKLNMLSYRMSLDLRAALGALEKDDDVRVIVVTGAGKAFCAGSEMTSEVFGPGYQEEHDRELEMTPDSVPQQHAYWKMHTPIIAAINGHAIGPGLAIPLLWDVRYAAEDAKLGLTFTRFGVTPDANAMWILPRMVGVSHAAELLLSGRTMTGREAAEIGLVSRALPREELLPAALELAHDIAENTSPVAVAATKKYMYRFLQETDREAAFALETKLIWWVANHPDANEAAQAFVEKRAPNWQTEKSIDIPDTFDKA